MLERPEDVAEVAVETRSWKATVGIRDAETRIRLLAVELADFSLDNGGLCISAHHYESLELPHLFRLLAAAVTEAHEWEAGEL